MIIGRDKKTMIKSKNNARLRSSISKIKNTFTGNAEDLILLCQCIIC